MLSAFSHKEYQCLDHEDMQSSKPTPTEPPIGVKWGMGWNIGVILPA
jgi:hypothetical protein